MSSSAQPVDAAQDRIILGLLNSVERDSVQSQRRLASELGIALGLVNAYLKRCVKKGLVKVNSAPARRYAYYLTPQGFAEKSRLTVEYLSYSLSFFRQARWDCSAVIAVMKANGWSRIVVLGRSDLTEIVLICALESGVSIVAIVDPEAQAESYLGVPLVECCEDAPPADAALIADLRQAERSMQRGIEQYGSDRVFAPGLLGLKTPTASGGAQ